jgi:hypothetical protein
MVCRSLFNLKLTSVGNGTIYSSTVLNYFFVLLYLYFILLLYSPFLSILLILLSSTISKQRTSWTRGADIIWKGRVHTLGNSALNSEDYDHLNSSSRPIDHSLDDSAKTSRDVEDHRATLY